MSFIGGGCFHTLGHVMIPTSDYILTEALASCKTILNKNAVFNCAHGTYHQYFLYTDQWKSGSTPFFPCDTNHEFPAACYSFILGLKYPKLAYKNMANICLSMTDENQRRGCFHGYGVTYSHQQIFTRSNVTLGRDLCVYGDKTDRHMCIEGAPQSLLEVNKTISRKVICETVHDSDLRELCMRAGTTSMKKDMNIYYSSSDNYI